MLALHGERHGRKREKKTRHFLSCQRKYDQIADVFPAAVPPDVKFNFQALPTEFREETSTILERKKDLEPLNLVALVTGEESKHSPHLTPGIGGAVRRGVGKGRYYRRTLRWAGEIIQISNSTLPITPEEVFPLARKNG